MNPHSYLCMLLSCRDSQLENNYSHVEVSLFSHADKINNIIQSYNFVQIKVCRMSVQNSTDQPDPVQQETLVYAEIGPSSFKKRAKPVVTLRPDDMDDRVEYAQLNHSLQKHVITTNPFQDSIAGTIELINTESCI